MSSYYGLLFPEYWDGPSGRLIQKLGKKDATILGAYLTSNRRANMLGLYRLPIEDIVNYTPLTRANVAQAFSILELPEVQFAQYDAATEFTWVREMARIRVGLRNRTDALKPDDKRVEFVNKLYQQLDDNPFLGAFFGRYQKTLHLKRQRTCEHHPKIEPIGRGSQGPGKPVTERTGAAIRDQATGAGIRDQGSEQGRAAPLARRETRTNPEAETIRVKVLVRLVHDALDEHPDWAEPGLLAELTEETKVRAAAAHIAYDGIGVTDAIDQALAQRLHAERAPLAVASRR